MGLVTGATGNPSVEPGTPAGTVAGFLYGRIHRTVAMATGKVVFFNDTGGYGFIETDEADEDVFVHMDDIEGPDLEEGEELEFEIVESEKGPRAQNPRRV